MVFEQLQSQKSLRVSLYTGIALVVISMLFLGRDQQTSSFLMQAVTILAAPFFFYAVGTLVHRYLDAPLAAPGLVATGAWLIAVSLLQLHDKRLLLPAQIEPYFWLIASGLAAVLITVTGHKIRIWLMLPLVPLMQINALWALLGVTGLEPRWQLALSFLLVPLWWEYRGRTGDWSRAYQVSGVLLTLFLLVFSYWLAPGRETLTLIWSVGAVTVALLGLRHGWLNLLPLAIVMLVGVSVVSLPATLWSAAWVGLATVTIVLIEGLAARDNVKRERGINTLEVSVALAVVLCGFAAAFVKVLPFYLVYPNPVLNIAVLLVSGVLMTWLGIRRQRLIATHIGLWLIAGAWSEVYFVGFAASNTFGLWLSLLAAAALLAERVITTLHHSKRKLGGSLTQAVTRWPLADLVIGLSVVIVIWGVSNILIAEPSILAATFGVLVGIWLLAGLIYRLPILLHLALWVSPLPLALLLMLHIPALRSLPLIGFAWQLLGVTLLLLGHGLYRHRPAVRAPFFMVGYGLLGVSLTLLLGTDLLVVGLGLTVLVGLATAVTVLSGNHGVWDAFVGWVSPPETRPYGHKHLRNAFVLLTAWLGAVWVQVLLGHTGLTLAQQGLTLVVLAGGWIMIGRVLGNLPFAVGWYVYSAGWIMWLSGLLLVYFAPTEALFVTILGLALSAEAIYRPKSLAWLPVFVLQVLFSVLQLSLLFDLFGLVASLLAVWQVLFVGGALLIAGGIHLFKRSHPTGFYTLADLLTHWSGILIWLGGMSVSVSGWMAIHAEQFVMFAGASTIAAVAVALIFKLRGLPSIAVSAATFTLLLQSLHMIDTYAGRVMIQVSLPLVALAAHGLTGLTLERRLPNRLTRLLVWWLRPLHRSARIIALVSFSLFLALALIYLIFWRVTDIFSRDAILVNGFLLAGLGVLRLYQTHHRRWLWNTLILSGLTWTLLLAFNQVSGALWYTLPFTVVLLLLAGALAPSLLHRRLEYLAVGWLVIGNLPGMLNAGLYSPATAALIVQLVLLLVYGYLAGRRIPFVSALLMMVAGAVTALTLVNVWLVLLLIGLVLLAQTLLLEARHDLMRRWIAHWLMRWQAWN